MTLGIRDKNNGDTSKHIHHYILGGGNSQGGGSSSNPALDDITDVDTTGVSNGQALIYNSSSGNWEGQTLAGGGDMLAATYDPNTVAGDAFDMDNMVEGATTKIFTNVERTKLTGVESGADVTDTANVTAAGALMDSEVTNLAQVKAFDASDYATAAQGALADSALQASDIGVSVQAYDATILNDSDIGVNVQAYDATLLNGADIGVSVQAYDATLLNSADIGVSVQAYDADTTKNDVANTFTESQVIQNAGNPNLRLDTGLYEAYLAISTISGGWFSGTAAGDTVVRAEDGDLWLGTRGTNKNIEFYVQGEGGTVARFDTNGNLILDKTLELSNAGGVAIDEFSDDGTLSGDSDLAVPTEQAVKTYVDTTTANMLETSDIGVSVQGYDATLLNSADIGVSVQAYDADTAKLDVAQEYTRTQNFNATTLTDGATINWDLSQNQVTSVTLGGNRTMAAPTNLVDGATYVLTVEQDATGSRTITWNAVFKRPGGTAPTLTATANAVDIITFVCDGTNLNGVASLDFS